MLKTHEQNQEAIQSALAAFKVDGDIDWVALEQLIEDGYRAKKTLELIRADCPHEYDYDHGMGQCMYCGDLDIREPEEYEPDPYEEVERENGEAARDRWSK